MQVSLSPWLKKNILNVGKHTLEESWLSSASVFEVDLTHVLGVKHMKVISVQF